jgi:hypothetical protein
MHDHLVEFYETESLLVESVRNFFRPALLAGDPVILVATPGHRSAFVAALEASGVDVQEARRNGRFVDLDAEETLGKFMVDGAPDPDLFDRVVGGLVRSSGRLNPRMRIYGEMVALLWDEDNRDAAIALENLWNDLSERERYTLLCAYPLSSMEWGPDNAPFREICSTHSSVRVRFCAPQAERMAVAESAKLPEDEFSQVKGLGFELSALKEVIRNANQMGRLAEDLKFVSKSGSSGLDYNLTG